MYVDIKEANELCKSLFLKSNELHNLNDKFNDIKGIELEKSNEEKILEKIAAIRGEKYVSKEKDDDIDDLENTINDTKNEIRELEESLFKTIENLVLDIPMDIPKIDDGKSELIFENGSYPDFIKYMSPLVGSTDIFLIDDVEMHKDRIRINNVSSPVEVIEKITRFVNDIGRLSSIKLNKVDPEVMEVVDIIYKLKKKEVWEATQGIKKFSYGDLFKKLNATESGDKKSIRNFITNLETTLKDRYPFIKKGNGEFEFSFFGSLVWNSYIKKYNTSFDSQIMDVDDEKIIDSENNNKGINATRKQDIINSYVDKDINKVLYGKVI